MTTETQSNNETGLTGLFSSMMGFTYASTEFTLQFLFTRPDGLVDRVRVTLENLSNALRDSIGDNAKRNGKDSNGTEREDAESLKYPAQQTSYQETAREASTTTAEPADVLSGRKR